VRNEQDGFSEVAGNDGVRGPPHPRRHFVERFTSGEALAHGLHIPTALADAFAGRLRFRVPHEPENCSVFGHDVNPRRQIQRGIIEDAIASGELKRMTDPELLIDALNGPLFFRWLQGHAPLENSFAERIFDKVLLAFQSK